MRQRSASAAALLGVLVMTSCTRRDLIDQDTRNRIAVCSAGIGLELSAGLRAELLAFEQGGSLSIAAQQEIRGAIFGETDLSDEVTAAVFNSYLGCIRQETQLRQYVEILENRRTTLLAALQAAGVSDEKVASLADLTQHHIEATRTGNLVLASDLYRRITLSIAEAQRTGSGLDEEDGFLYMPS